ncbi:hypothetical protein AGOR_G00038820 [Albula goreensis]|uniref:C-type lectin domain-containing protein n=1 Tax=Albula goreensis TaxID=1534307 RepID=A0A8T3E1H7_9TELE|nr:hypothetical protein AGOR_G00038820 [Albula goreensis]
MLLLDSPKKKPIKKDTVSTAAIEDLQKQIDDLTQEVMLLKEQQALQTVCLKGMKIHGKCYLADTQVKPFHSASEDCISKGGTLSTPMTSDENDQLYEYVRKNMGLGVQIWLGINDMVTEGQWLDQTGSQVRYTNWDTKVIRKPGGDRSLNCAILSGVSKGMWYEQNCRSNKASVCEFNIV